MKCNTWGSGKACYSKRLCHKVIKGSNLCLYYTNPPHLMTFPKELKKHFVIQSLLKYFLVSHPTVHDMIIGKRKFYSEWTGHVHTLQNSNTIVNSRFDSFTLIFGISYTSGGSVLFHIFLNFWPARCLKVSFGIP